MAHGRNRRTVLRWTGYTLAVLLGALILLAIDRYQWLRGSVPDLTGSYRVAGLTHAVEIIRDRHGVPHIYAASKEDALFGLGFVHAQDRLWQMEQTRLAGQGRLAEVLGRPALDIDRMMRAGGFARYAALSLEGLPPETRAAAEAYAAGVNAWIGQRDRPLPPEFLLLLHRPEPWTAADSMLMLKIIGLALSSNAGSELLRSQLLTVLTPRQVEEFLPAHPDSDAPALPDLSALYASTPGLTALAALMPPPEFSAASNNWAVAGRRSETGAPLLANDPHLLLSAPSFWYLAHLSFDGRDVIGATMPGLPAILLGRTDSTAWAFTSTGADVQDIFIEKLNPENPDEYLTPQGYVPFETREETIRVRFGADVVVTLRESRHGPVVPVDAGLTDGLAVPPGHAAVLAWTGFTADNTTLQAAFNVMWSERWRDFEAVLQTYHVPVQNTLFADRDGNIAFIAPGLIPVRHDANTAEGRLPVPGWDTVYEWQGMIPFSRLPRHVNPRFGMLYTANQKVVDDDYPYLITHDWHPPYRALRMRQLLDAHESHSMESFAAMQRDTVSLAARELLPHLLRTKPQDDASVTALMLLAGWDGDMRADAPEPLIYAGWLRSLSRHIFADELGKIFETAWTARPEFLLNVLRNIDGQARWCNDITTATTESCSEMLSRSLKDALADLRRRHGVNMRSWRWGAAHRAMHRHTLMGGVPILRRFFNIEHESPGGDFTINRGAMNYRDSQPFASIHGPAYRAIYDLADPENSLFIISTGQSGNPFSPLYRNLNERWAGGDYIPMTTRRADIVEGALGTITLLPAGQSGPATPSEADTPR